jgi:hypothetical protein
MNPKLILLLLFWFYAFTSFSQSLDSLPTLQKVFASIESNFKPFKGGQKLEHLPNTVYSSIRSIERTLDNEIVEFPGKYAAYFASLGSELSLKSAKALLNKWKPVLDKLLRDYFLESQKLEPTLGNNYIGYQYAKTIGLQFYTVDLYYLKTEKKDIYQAALMFTSAKGEIK